MIDGFDDAHERDEFEIEFDGAEDEEDEGPDYSDETWLTEDEWAAMGPVNVAALDELLDTLLEDYRINEMLTAEEAGEDMCDAGPPPASVETVARDKAQRRSNPVTGPPAQQTAQPVVISRFTKPSDQPPLSKHYRLSPMGEPTPVGKAGSLSNGSVETITCDGVAGLAEVLRNCTSWQALAIGVTRAPHRNDDGPALPLVVKDKADAAAGVLARSLDFFEFDEGAGFLFVDKDKKGMPPKVAKKIESIGSLFDCLVEAAPEIAGAAHVVRSSTSSGLSNNDTGQVFPNSGGEHLYLAVSDARDIHRATKELHRRMWLAGLGWIWVDATGRMHERSIVDVAVASPERLIFEGSPVLEAPLVQETSAREPVVFDGEVIDTAAIIPPLTPGEQAKYRQLVNDAKAEMQGDADVVKNKYMEDGAREIVKRSNVTLDYARQQMAEMFNHRLGPNMLLQFDRQEVGIITVAEVLNAPDAYLNLTLADPLEGIAYGAGKAKVMRNNAGGYFIHSFAHGRTTYDLCYDAAMVEDILNTPPANTALDRYAAAMVNALVPPGEAARLRLLAKKVAGVGLADVDKVCKAVKAARKNALASSRTAVSPVNSAAATKFIPLATHSEGVTVDHFVSYLPDNKYIFVPDGKLWGVESIRRALPPVPTYNIGSDEIDGVTVLGGEDMTPADEWLDKHRPIHSMTWAPGEPPIIHDRFIDDGGWREHTGVNSYNSYRAAAPMYGGDPALAAPWIDHINRLYPNEVNEIITWFAHRVQKPNIKINHALCLFGEGMGIGKDFIISGVKPALGPWNVKEIRPKELMGDHNEFLKSVILLISEIHDREEISRSMFFDMTKDIIAAPPETKRISTKYVPHYYIQNMTGVVMTSNYLELGLFLPPDDRRHFVCWSEVRRSDLPEEYFSELFAFYRNGGFAHIDAFLRSYDVSGFDPKAPPRQTEAFRRITNASVGEDSTTLEAALDKLKDKSGNRPKAVTLKMLRDTIMSGGVTFDQETLDKLTNKKYARAVPAMLSLLDYIPIHNPADKSGRWRFAGGRGAIYVRRDLTLRDQLAAARALGS